MIDLMNGSPSNPSERPINRLGCGVHLLMPGFRALTYSPLRRSVTRALGYQEPRVTQSQSIVQSAGRGSVIVPHQDVCVSFTDPQSCLTFWYAFEDANIKNGCLFVARSSHVTQPIRKQLVEEDHGVPSFQTLATPLWARGSAS